MSTTQGCNDGKDVIESFKEALQHRLGEEKFGVWFTEVQYEFCDADPQEIVVWNRGQFAAERLVRNYLKDIRAAARTVCGDDVRVRVDVQPAQQIALPFSETDEATASGDDVTTAEPTKPARPTKPVTRRGKKPGVQSVGAILADGRDSRDTGTDASRSTNSPAAKAAPAAQSRPEPAASTSPPTAPGSTFHWESFVGGDSNHLARAACQMAIQDPAAASPLLLWGPPGCGKTHLLHAVAAKLRSVHRMRRVMYLPAEEFTNDFLKALHGNCLPAFRSRFRDLDALLIDDVQFFVEKKATTRELHHTIEMLAEFRRPLVFAGAKAPQELQGLGGELSGRLASGLVCQVQPLDVDTRMQLLSQYADERCQLAWPDATLREIAKLVDGDGRVLSGIVNLVGLLQRMNSAMPTMDQIRQHGGHLLRSAGVPITLNAIERAVEKVFSLETKSLQSTSQAKSVTEPRMLAMYLSRELTSSAYSEIGGHFGGRSHSTAILANQRVRQWLDGGKSVGRGSSALSTEEAIRRIESLLKTG